MPFGPSGGYPPLFHVFHFYQGDPFSLTTTHYNDLVYLMGGVHGLNTGAGNDIIYSQGQSEIRAGSGDDVVYSLGRDYMVDGGTGNDTLYGSTSHDNLSGGGEGDLILAGTGGDYIKGGTGDDTLSGGSGSDFFDFDVGDGHDIITDYQAGIDVIAISFFGSGERPDVSYEKIGPDWVITYGSDGATITLHSEVFNPDDLLIA